MPRYRYTAQDIKGNRKTGIIEAASETALIAHLREQQLYLLSYKTNAAAGGSSAGMRLNSKQLAQFNYELGSMLSSGISLIRAVEIILRRDIPKKQRVAYEEIYRSLLNGMALSDSMEKLGGVFPELLINMYRAGEANGTLDQTANRMAEHYEKEQRLKSKLKSASTYPMILMCLTIAVMVLIFTVVLPKFLALYGDAPLPAITQAVIGISILFTQHTLGLIIGILLIIFTLMSIYRLPKVRYKVDKLKLKVFIIGKLMRTVYTARFARTLSSLYSSGLSILTALQICRGTIGNAYIAAQFEDLIKNVRNGSALSESVEQIDGYDKKLSSTILIGEESGQLEHMLLAVADSFDYESEQATARLSSMLEPILIILMALLVGTVIFSVMLPIIQMYGNMGL